MGICSSTKCVCKKTPVLKQSLAKVFSYQTVALIRAKQPKQQMNSDPSEIEEDDEYEFEGKLDIGKISKHVKQNSKQLQEHLESYPFKIFETMELLAKRLKNTRKNSDLFIILFLIQELLKDFDTYFYNKNQSRQYQIEKKQSMLASFNEIQFQNQTKEDKENQIQDSILIENVTVFEKQLFDIVWYYFNKKSKKQSGLLQKLSLQLIIIYSKKIPVKISLEDSLRILRKIFKFEQDITGEKVINFASLNLILDTLYHLALKMKIQLVKDFHQDFYKILFKQIELISQMNGKKLQFKNSLEQILQRNESFEDTVLEQSNQINEQELKKNLEETKKKTINLIEIICQISFQINDYQLLINPFFVFFNNKDWHENYFYDELIEKMLEVSKIEQMSENLEIHLIEKILEFLDYEKNTLSANMSYQSQQVQQPAVKKMDSLNSKQKYSESIQFKIKMMKLLRFLFSKLTNNYLAFVYIDKFMKVFTFLYVGNLKNISEIQEEHPDYELYENLNQICVESYQIFLKKILPISKHITNIMIYLLDEIDRKSDNPQWQFQTEAMMNLFLETAELVFKQCNLQIYDKSLFLLLLKISQKEQYLIQSYKAISLIICCKSNQTFSMNTFHNQKLSTNQLFNLNSDNHELQPTVIIFLMIDIQNQYQKMIQKFQPQEKYLNNIFSFIYHIRAICMSIMQRKIINLLEILSSFFIQFSDNYQEHILQNNQSLSESVQKGLNLLFFFHILDFFNQVAKQFEYLELQNFINNLVLNLENKNLINLLTLLEDQYENSEERTQQLFQDIYTSGTRIQSKELPKLPKELLIKHLNQLLTKKQENQKFSFKLRKFEDFFQFAEKKNQQELKRMNETLETQEINISIDQEIQKDSSKSISKLSAMQNTQFNLENKIPSVNSLNLNNSFENALNTVRNAHIRRKKLENLIEI